MNETEAPLYDGKRAVSTSGCRGTGGPVDRSSQTRRIRAGQIGIEPVPPVWLFTRRGRSDWTPDAGGNSPALCWISFRSASDRYLPRFWEVPKSLSREARGTAF